MKIQKSKTKEYRDSFKLIHQTDTGEKVYRLGRSILIKLPENRNSVITSWINGGYREDLQAIFNHQLNQSEIDHLENGPVPEFMRNTAKKMGMDPGRTSGFLTVAYMDNVAIITKTFREIEVTAIVTAGIEVNGGRAGDTASYYELNGTYEFEVGTINTVLIVNCNLSESTLIRSMMTAVEAKTVALQELMAPSKYSHGVATGSGTDNIAIISNMESEDVLTSAGKHSKLGELIGKSVIEATKQSLSKQSNLNPDSQCDMLVRLERFKVDPENYWEHARSAYQEPDKTKFMENLHDFSKNPLVVSLVASILHLIDETSWGLASQGAAEKTAISLMKTLPDLLKIENVPNYEKLLDQSDSVLINWIRVSTWVILNMKK
ncbi:adenosylcobinamide amidohydrolase [Methanobacterium petrolearium]|uniref:adenosylcobinamide amidohydrolase n=1 Tax=Methanobacterium petrolearium TaxID=710190 RepID=UPI001AE53EEE|nr:adenosylcobinamide amidohydrolase [Methanobacterium petrolearium]MBP1946953.1 adenosylcobinamide hydrolase [Methanobacterium petrolearium]BDZ70904.1 adenosylcobinamide amidohydrolase [Methanobacterium petrolearium]